MLIFSLFLGYRSVYGIGKLPSLVALGMNRQDVEYIFGSPLFFQTYLIKSSETNKNKGVKNVINHVFYRSSFGLDDEYPQYIFTIFLNNHLLQVIGFYDLYDYQNLALKFSEQSDFVSGICQDLVYYRDQRDDSYYILQRIDDESNSNLLTFSSLKYQFLQLTKMKKLYVIFYYNDLVSYSLYGTIQQVLSLPNLFSSLEDYIFRK